MITTKWPRLLVVGEPVTPEQADEILIRTDGWLHRYTNDKQWAQIIDIAACQITGRPLEAFWELAGDERTESLRVHHEAEREWRERHGILRLRYLTNSQIASSWIGGPHGWCDWDGRIGCDHYNIGKWPDDDDVTEDWRAIAAAFPYLDLTAQCIEDEGEGNPAAEWRIQGGTVEYNPNPTKQITTPTDTALETFAAGLIHGRSERGVSEGRLRAALERVTAGVSDRG
ncbi:hypothetical protein [Nocardia gipuzkoensis]|uniref:hypothetical protein n=1 Tax=Nocardia gipuzkoensis TaxID=2749991 RepID=UPI00237E39A4|nr:hypothetical protein [Nocardia gipuzkoensis]MDE1673802.1 hypothetical protein [Nocardia gipuzkoensis]